MQNSAQVDTISQAGTPGDDANDWWDERLGGSRALRRLRDLSPTLSSRRLNARGGIAGSRTK